MFATGLVGTLDLDSGALRYSRAGHMPPVTVDRAGDVTVHTEAAGAPIGAGLDDSWPEAESWPGSTVARRGRLHGVLERVSDRRRPYHKACDRRYVKL